MNDNLEKIHQLISEANITIQRLKDVTATGYRRKQSNIKQPVK